MPTIDLNADVGEGEAADAELLAIVSSCNIACGGHAGDTTSMRDTIVNALQNDVAVGAHPSYPDRDGFGRRAHHTTGNDLYESLTAQLALFIDIAAEAGATVCHLKPHGALYHDAATDAGLADLLARVTDETPGAIALVGPPGSALQNAAQGHGLGFIAEAFIDRAYEDDGKLVPRSLPGAVHTDVAMIIKQAVSLAFHQRVISRTGNALHIAADTLCIHGDTRNPALAARRVRAALEEQGVVVASVRPCRPTSG